MARRDPSRSGGELNFGHAEQRTPRAVHDERGQGVVQFRSSVRTQLDLPTAGFVVEAVAQQCQQRMRVREVFQGLGLHLAEARQCSGRQHRVHGRCFEFVADGSVNGCHFQEVVGVHGLRRSIPPCHRFFKNSGRQHNRMQEGASSQPTVGVRRT